MNGINLHQGLKTFTRISSRVKQSPKQKTMRVFDSPICLPILGLVEKGKEQQQNMTDLIKSLIFIITVFTLDLGHRISSAYLPQNFINKSTDELSGKHLCFLIVTTLMVLFPSTKFKITF